MELPSWAYVCLDSFNGLWFVLTYLVGFEGQVVFPRLRPRQVETCSRVLRSSAVRLEEDTTSSNTWPDTDHNRCEVTRQKATTEHVLDGLRSCQEAQELDIVEVECSDYDRSKIASWLFDPS
jgi:hypothetical protein